MAIRVIHIITGLSTGGAEIMLLELLKNIDRCRFDPVVISLTSKGEIGPRIEALGINVITLNMNPSLPNPLKVFELYRLLRKIHPDVIHTWMHHANLMGGIAGRLAGLNRIIWSIHQSNLDPDKNKRVTLLIIKFCAYLSKWIPWRILTCSVAAGEVHTRIGFRADILHFIPNGFDLSRYKPDSDARYSVLAELRLPDETPLVGLIARNDPQKNVSGFIKAAAHIHKLRPDVHFIVAGQGLNSQNEALYSYVNSLGLNEFIHLLGRRSDIPRLMSAMTLLTSTSSGEAFPLVVGEAMACAVPCVVTNVGDSAEIVGDTGRVVPAGDMYELANSVLELLALNETERAVLGTYARERTMKHFEIAEITRKHENLYQQTLFNMDS